MRFRSYNPADGDLGGSFAQSDYGNKNSVPTGQWIAVSYENATASGIIEQIKTNGGITMYLELGDSNSYDFTYYVDDLEVTDVDANVTITAEDKTVTFAADTPVEIATFGGDNFNTDYLTVMMNGTPYTDYTFAEGKLSFTPPSLGIYKFVYTHKNGHIINTVTQTVTVEEAYVEPAFTDSIEGDTHATILSTTLDGTPISVSVQNSPYWEHTSHSGSKMLLASTVNNKTMLLQLTDETVNILEAGDTLSVWVYVNGGPSDRWITNAAVYAKNGETYTETDTKCDDYGVDKVSSLTKKTWYQLKIKLTDQSAVDTLKTSKTIGISVNLGDGNGGIEFFIDDIQVTHAQAN